MTAMADAWNKETFASELVNSGVKFGEAVDHRGQCLPWVVDCREVLLRQPYLTMACRELWRRIRRYHPDVIAGMTLSADPLITGVLFEALSDGKCLSGAIIRKKPKDYGLRRQVEGPQIIAGSRIVLVDDLINTGGTAKECIRALGQTGARVIALGVIVDFGDPGARRWLRRMGIALEALYNTSDLGMAPRLALKRCGLGNPVPLALSSWFQTSDESVGDKLNTSESEPRKGSRTSGKFRIRLIGEDKRFLIVQHGGHAACANLDALSWTWMCHLGQPSDVAPVASASTVAFALDEDDGQEPAGRIVAIRVDNGTLLWSKHVRRRIRAMAACSEQLLLIVSTQDETFSLRLADGEVAWAVGRPAAALALTKGLYFARDEMGLLRACAVRDGRERWVRPVGRRDKSILVATATSVVTVAHRRSVLAFDTSGRLRWLSTLAYGNPSAVTWVGGAWAVATGEEVIWILDDVSGTPDSSVPSESMDDITSDGTSSVWTVDSNGVIAKRTISYLGGGLAERPRDYDSFST